MDKNLCSKESDTEYRRLSGRVLRWNEVSNIHNSFFDKSCTSNYLWQTEETDTGRQRSLAQILRKYSRKFGPVSTKSEVSNTEMRKTMEPLFIYWCLTQLSVTPPAAFPVVSFLTEWWNTHDVTVNEVLYKSKFLNIERVNGLRKTRENFHCAESYFEGNLNFLLSENL